jgi:hypothetical protein
VVTALVQEAAGTGPIIKVHVRGGSCECTTRFLVYGRIYGYESKRPVPVAARPKAWVCGRSPSESVGSNPAVSMDSVS